MGDLSPKDLVYQGPHEAFSKSDSFTYQGKVWRGQDAAMAVAWAFFDVLSSADSADPVGLTPDTHVDDYADSVESAREARADLLKMGCPAKPFSSAASEVLMKRGTDPSVPNDLSSLKMPPEDGTAVG